MVVQSNWNLRRKHKRLEEHGILIAALCQTFPGRRPREVAVVSHRGGHGGRGRGWGVGHRLEGFTTRRRGNHALKFSIRGGSFWWFRTADGGEKVFEEEKRILGKNKNSINTFVSSNNKKEFIKQFYYTKNKSNIAINTLVQTRQKMFKSITNFS